MGIFTCFKFYKWYQIAQNITYGLHTALELFQGTIWKIICGIENAENSQDSHNETLRKVLDEIWSNGLKLNNSKCQIAVKELLFLRHIISSEEVKPDHKKVEAILDILKPTNKNELWKILGED